MKRSTAMNNFDWSDLAFGSKKVINNLNAIFVAAPREISQDRFKQLVKDYLPKSNIILGISKDPYVAGLETQPQFRTLKLQTVQGIIDKVNGVSGKNKIYVLSYFQRETNYIFEKLKFSKVLLVNGSWHHAFHNLPAYYALVNSGKIYEHISPFTNEQEAKSYNDFIFKEIAKQLPEPVSKNYSDVEMMHHAQHAAKLSFDYNFQTGASLGKKNSRNYKYLARTFNRVVPYQTYAMHYGASRETNFSPPHDLNHYDTVHAEAEMIIKAQKEKMSLKGTTLFINLMPCPACARMLAETDIQEFVYGADHSNGYAVNLLEQADKKVRRLVI
jgi:deoxycytidylate deaminase